MTAVIHATESWLALTLAITALGFLIYALVKPERF